MKLTPRGRTIVAFAFAFGVGGRLLGLEELAMVGASLIVVLLVGAIALWLRQGSAEVRRQVKPSRTVADQAVNVGLAVRIRGRVGRGPLLLEDTLPSSLGEPVRVTLDPLRGGRTQGQAAYTLRPPVRGRYMIGPLAVLHTDPFGALIRRQEVPSQTMFIVYPSYEAVDTMPSGVQRLGVVRHSPLLGEGDEFYALREYEEGDDLRKVHWPTSMKRGHLHVRQEELLGEPRVFVVLDTCGGKHRGRGRNSSLEAAISACASVTTLAIARRMRVDVFTPDGPLLKSRRATTEDVLEHLAVLEPSRHRDLSSALAHLEPRRMGTSAVAVVITPGLNAHEAGSLARLAGQVAAGAVVRVAAETFGRSRPRGEPAKAERSLGSLGFPVLELRSGDSFRQVWETGVRDVALA